MKRFQSASLQTKLFESVSILGPFNYSNLCLNQIPFDCI